MSDTRLSYAVYPNPNPIQASPLQGAPSLVTLLIVVSNSTNEVIDCESISFGFKQGSNAKDFSTDFTSVSTAPADGWSITQDGAFFTATPDNAPAQVGREGLTFYLSNIKVNQQPGTTSMTITEVTTNPDNTAELDCQLEKFPTQFSVGQLIAEPLTINQGQSTTLSWNGSAGATYALSYRDAGNTIVNITQTADGKLLPPVGSYTVRNLQHDTVFYLIVTLQESGQDGPVTFQREVTVTVVQPPVRILSFSAAPQTVSYPGEQVTLSWEVENATALILSDVGGVDGNSINVTVNQTQTFTLQAAGQGGPVSAVALVVVTPVQINSFKATPGVVYGKGNNVEVKLDWMVQSAKQLFLNDTIVAGNSTTSYVNDTTNFLLEATGYPVDVAAQVTVTAEDVNLKVWTANQNVNVSFMANVGAYQAVIQLTYVFPALTEPIPVTQVYKLTAANPGLTQFSQSLSSIPPFLKLLHIDVTLTGFPSGPVTASYTPQS